MFRTSIRRCANQARTAAAAALISQTRAALPVARRQALSAQSSIATLNKIAFISRAYSAEATAQASQPTSSAPAEEPAKFSDLENVDQTLLRAIIQGMKYETMTPVQAKTIVPALKGTDIVAQAKTGTGKTLAFLLPLLQRMIDEDPTLANRGARREARSDDIRGIVLSPTRELAEQIAVEARRLTANTGLVVQCAVGGTDKRQMLHQTRRQGCHLLVATPGRLNDLLQDPRSNIEAPNLAALVLDEADRMLDTGFERELNEIQSQLPRPTDKIRQTMLVSATIPDSVIRLARTMVRADDFEFVQTIPENESLTHDKVPQHIVPVSGWTHVFPSLFELIDREAAKSFEDPNARPFKAIVYFNTTSLVELAGEMGFHRQRNSRSRGTHPLHTYVMQSKLTQTQRQKAADMFRGAKSGVLFSSDVTARGMDFPDVTHVIQVDTPRDRESYIHRLGRTGRQNKEGEGWLIIPHASIGGARKLLSGLPIKQNNSLESAETDVEGGEATPAHKDTRAIFEVMPRRLLSSTYASMFGVSVDKITLAEDVNNWTRHGWGWDSPPYVSPLWVNKMGLSRARGMNIKSNDFDDGDDTRFRGVDRTNRDPFDAMSRDARRDDSRSRSSRSGRPYNRGRSGGHNSRGSSYGSSF
ncbi:hypothetical protein FSOLCH5_005965 [Fusarium solani]|uniref:ATP-dependent RNA helicase n=1 Tax=Fusarium solani TaxID=169388 RepID=A0A9P9L7B0_FUSSL|nr:P-loop containing nucleoside triphosphate hydrolase protein [Fusarium solani]KAH7275307.1 P-loop containing nucleoside triphosphate hydrolase protein [Fusarium solani]KAJ3465820.1 hypothetical protein MRS44_006478 [Fusarium solani]KAJ4225439.1 hypothetical protein NW759_005134 [Fusarium solani]